MNINVILLIFICYDDTAMCLQERNHKEMDIILSKCERWLLFEGHWVYITSSAEEKMDEHHYEKRNFA